MDNNQALEQAMNCLRDWTIELAETAGLKVEDGVELWNEIKNISDLLREYAYYHDKGDFLCEYRVENYTVADILIWQMDHFRSHMDRSDAIQRYDKPLLIFNTFKTMVELTKNPESIISQFEQETGTDLPSGWTVY